MLSPDCRIPEGLSFRRVSYHVNIASASQPDNIKKALPVLMNGHLIYCRMGEGTYVAKRKGSACSRNIILSALIAHSVQEYASAREA